MKKRFRCDPKDILVGIAPSLGPCCAFFSDPGKELPPSFGKFIDDEKRVDLWSFSVEQLQSHGISPGHIEIARVCTQCNNGPDIESRGRFYSYRGEKGITGRFGVLVWLR
jgi:copper oxidase (laccase) domain-containing protein